MIYICYGNDDFSLNSIICDSRNCPFCRNSLFNYEVILSRLRKGNISEAKRPTCISIYYKLCILRQYDRTFVQCRYSSIMLFIDLQCEFEPVCRKPGSACQVLRYTQIIRNCRSCCAVYIGECCKCCFRLIRICECCTIIISYSRH